MHFCCVSLRCFASKIHATVETTVKTTRTFTKSLHVRIAAAETADLWRVRLTAPDKGCDERSTYDTPHMTLVFLTFYVGVLAAQL